MGPERSAGAMLDCEWRTFFLVLCECAAVDPTTACLDKGFVQFFDWLPPDLGPERAVSHVLDVMALDQLADVLTLGTRPARGASDAPPSRGASDTPPSRATGRV